MKLYVGITDRGWYDRLSAESPDEVNFWKPGANGTFSALSPGGLFLFKLHAPEHFIVGGGFFVRFSRLPMRLAWEAFGTRNGVGSLHEFRARIAKFRKSDPGIDPVIGNIVLTQPFWFPMDAWIPRPKGWPNETVQGKTYPLVDPVGSELYAEVQARLGSQLLSASETRRTYDGSAVLRLGQGAFRVAVTDAYCCRCAITGESTLPVLEAAHIKPFAADGPSVVGNGLLLRSDMHTLFDRGLITVTPDLRIEVSSQIREAYVNGKLYYSYQGQELRSLPNQPSDRPLKELLSWHNENVYIS